MGGTQCGIELYVDPCCPFAWIAYQWLAEVRRHRPAVELGLHLMSLPVLNEHQSISPGYRRLLAHTWGPARVAAAAIQQHGPDVLAPLYEAMARRIFGGADHYQQIREDLDSVIADALSEVGLPAQLTAAAATGDHDAFLRGSHNTAMAPIGSGVGTPIIHLDRSAFFGPVMTAVPRGSQALQVFDGLLLLAGYPAMFEIKRPVAGSLELGPTDRGKDWPGSTVVDTAPIDMASVESS